MYSHPTNKQECAEQLYDVYRSLARVAVPQEYINTVMHTTKHKTSLKRLREKVISDGYQLMMHLEEAMKKSSLMNDHLWQQKVVLFWNHFSFSVLRMNEYIQEHGLRYEQA